MTHRAATAGAAATAGSADTAGAAVTAGAAATVTRGCLLLYPLVAEAARPPGCAGQAGLALAVLECAGASCRTRVRGGRPREGGQRSQLRRAASPLARDEVQEDLLKTKGFTKSRH